LAGAKLSSEGGIVQCSVIGWRDDACRLRKAVPKCLGTGAECQSVFRHFGTVGAEVSWGRSVSSPTRNALQQMDDQPFLSHMPLELRRPSGTWVTMKGEQASQGCPGGLTAMTPSPVVRARSNVKLWSHLCPTQ